VVLAAALSLAVMLSATPVLGGRQAPSPQTVAMVATDDAVAAKKSVAVLTNNDTFAQLFVPAATPIVHGDASLPLARIKTGAQIICRGSWTDATRSVFRASWVSVGTPLSATALRHRVALACQRVSTRPNTDPATKIPRHSRVTATEDFVLEEWSLERDDAAPTQPGTGNAAYHARGVLRNISGQSFERVELAISILDRDGKKVFDQSALTYNVRAGDRWQFAGSPLLYLPFKQGQTVRVDQISAITE
jgi:hypothetical protein